ncbi:MAG: HEPN domain-containing protein [Dehalococcoidia bacterium]
MTSDIEIQAFLAKAEENVASAVSEFVNGRYNACANRCYYACFQAAVAALLHRGIRPRGRGAGWGHGFVQAQFAGVLIGRRKVYGATLRDTLPRLLELRERADYEATQVSQTQANRALSRAQDFVSAVVREGEQL